MKTILILELGNSKAMPYELATEDENGNFQTFETGFLPGEGALEELRVLEVQADEKWVCDSLVTKQNLRKS